MATSPSATPTPITPPRVPLIDARTGLIDRAWYMFFLSLFSAAQTSGDSLLNPNAESLIASYDAALRTLAQATETQPPPADCCTLVDAVRQEVQTSYAPGLPELTQEVDQLRQEVQTSYAPGLPELTQEVDQLRQEVQTLPRSELGTFAALQQANLPWTTFDTTPESVPTDIGTVAWDGGTTLGVQMTANVLQQVGESEYVYAKASSAITKGQLCYHTGAMGASGVITVAPTPLALADPNQIVGVAAETIALNGFGLIQVSGVLRGFNTTGSSVGEVWADGDALYYNPAYVGSMTKVKPSAPNQKSYIGEVINAGSGGSGSMSIRIVPGSTLGGTDSNVQITGVANNDLLAYDSTDLRWENKDVTTTFNLPALAANGVLYLNGAKVATSGSALTFDGTNSFAFGNSGTGNTVAVLTLKGGSGATGGSAVTGTRNGADSWFIGDTSTGLGSGSGFLYYNYTSGDPWIWYDGGASSERMRLTSTGLGIGTSSPDAKLDVVVSAGLAAVFGSESASNSYVGFKYNSTTLGYVGNGAGVAAGSAATDFSIGSTGARALTFGTNDTERARIDASGNLGLGVTPSAWLASQKALEVSGWSVNAASLTSTIATNAYINASSQWIYKATGFATRYDNVTGQHQWYTAPSGTAGAQNATALTAVQNGLSYTITTVGSTDFTLIGAAANTVGTVFVKSGGTGLGTGTATQNIIFIEAARVTETNNQVAFQPAESAQNASVTLTVANLQTRIITSNAAVTLTLPTGTSLEGYTTGMATDTAFECTFIATTANAITIGANGNTTVGSLTVAGNSSGLFRFRKTATNTFTVYRII